MPNASFSFLHSKGFVFAVIFIFQNSKTNCMALPESNLTNIKASSNTFTGRRKWSIVQTKGTRPGARDGHSACVINKKIYIFGGYEEELDRFSDDIHTFCFETNMWEFVRTKVFCCKSTYFI